jgi:hypothetical protein
MYKSSTYIVVTYFLTYIRDSFLTKLVTKVKPNINSVEVHPQLSNNREFTIIFTNLNQKLLEKPDNYSTLEKTCVHSKKHLCL